MGNPPEMYVIWSFSYIKPLYHLPNSIATPFSQNLRIYKQQIEKTLEALENKDGEYLNQLFSSAKEYRDSIIEHK